MHIRKATYKKEDVDCKLCTEYRGKKHPCPHDVCPFITERIEAGAVTYWDAVNAMVSSQYRFSRRLPKLAEEYPGTLFLDDRHRSRMEFLNTQSVSISALKPLTTASDTLPPGLRARS